MVRYSTSAPLVSLAMRRRGTRVKSRRSREKSESSLKMVDFRDLSNTDVWYEPRAVSYGAQAPTMSADSRLRPPTSADTLFLLSTATHWAVLINTNCWYGCKELKSRSHGQTGHATNFERLITYASSGCRASIHTNTPDITLRSLHQFLVTPGFREISKS